MNCVVIAVHPDDETIGCGGTLLKHKFMGDTIHWIILTDVKEKYGFSRRSVENRKQEIIKVGQAYPFNSIHHLKYPTAHLDEYPISEIVQKIGHIFSKTRPEVVYLPFRNDVHSDHRVAFQAAFSCTKTFRYPSIKRVLMMETISETEFSPAIGDHSFIPNVFVNISDFMDRKLEIADFYESEIKEFPFPRSKENIKALAMFRGATAGCNYSESFMLLKDIQ